uniref:Gamma-secretase activating protein n=1 Tax=Peromyscus maniculatus bairdii TaxID=230844 RepID=A0A8C8W785_PERMB
MLLAQINGDPQGMTEFPGGGMEAQHVTLCLTEAVTVADGVLETAQESLRVLNIERNGNIIYTYKDNKGNAVFGLYDCQTRQNEHLYTFEKDMQAVSCSVNSERTLLAASFIQYTKEGVRNELQPGSKCLTLLVEIHPVNNVKVLKAVESCIWVQFLYPHVESHLLQNHLLLISEEKCKCIFR